MACLDNWRDAPERTNHIITSSQYHIITILLVSVLPLAPTGPLQAGIPPAHVVRIAVTPASLLLDGRESRQLLLITGYRPDGSAIDLTDSALVESNNTHVILAENGTLRPVSDGAARIVVRAGGAVVTVPVVVQNTRKPFHWTFENHVESVFSKQGCNTGPCHGAGSGKGGLKLSLRAYDPDSDYFRLRTEGRGRRIVRARPRDSLLLKKPSLAEAHVGGLKLRRDSLEYRVVSEWIANGARGPSPNTPKLVRLGVFPTDRTLSRGSCQRLLVTACFSDGHTEDVTHWARYSSNEEPIARVDDTGKITMRGRGETAVTAWYLGKFAFARVRVPFNAVQAASIDKINRNGFSQTHPVDPVNPVKESPIDQLIEAKLSQLGLKPSARCTDGEFIRRAFLDCIGTLPAPEETRGFLADVRPGKRERLIEALLDRPEFVDFWTYRWGDLLRVNRNLIGGKAAAALQSWIRACVAGNVGWDRFASDVLTAGGPADADGPASFYRMGTKPEEFAETVSQAFLGIRVQCAHCHNHPFEKWTQSDYYRMANVFARVVRKDVDGVEIVFAGSTGDVSHPRIGRPLPPAAFDGPSASLTSVADRRTFLARWMIGRDNPYFARAVVNRVWKQFMGRGLVEPVDDMRLTNPASNEPLLQAVTRDFVESGFDLRQLMARIMRSRAYQRSAASATENAADDRFYSHYLARRVSAETLLDAVCQVTAIPEKFVGIPAGARAISLFDTKVASTFLDAFGRPARQVTCECERNMEPNMAQALHLINAATLNAKILAKDGTLARLLDAGASDDAIADNLYLRCLSRPPHAAERVALRSTLTAALAGVDATETRRQVFADLLWALLSSPEFIFNH